MSQSIFDLFKTVIEGIQKEPAKNPATTTPDPTRRAPTNTVPADERWRVRRDTQAERARKQRDERFGRHMRTQPAEETQAQVDAHNQEMLERAVAKFETQRDEVEKVFVKQRDAMIQKFSAQMEKLSTNHSTRLEKMLETARGGKKIRGGTAGTERYDQWRRKTGKPSWAQ